MAHTEINNPSRPLPWIFLHLACAVLIALFLIVSIQIAGIEIMRIYLTTSYWHYPALLFLLSGALIIMNILFAVYGLVSMRKGTGYMPPVTAATITLAMMIMFLLIAWFYARMHHPPVSARDASASCRFWTRIGPVVQFGPFADRKADTSSSMVIWYFDPVRKEGPSALRYGREPFPEGMALLKEAAGDGKRHEFHLTGLAPSTPYYYQVPDWGDAIYSFRTGPARGSSEPFRFMALADTGNTRRGGYAPSYAREVLGAAAEWYASMNALPAFKLHAGDMVRAGSDLDAWHSHFSSDVLSASIPGITVPGNHELLEDRGANFRYFFGEPDYYAIDHGSARIFSIHPFDGPGTTLDGPILATGADQYRWIQNELARTSGRKWLIVVIHIPVLSTGDYGENELLMAQYSELFRRYKVDLVISGHDHNFDSFHVDDDTDWGGTIYIVAGTGGSGLDSYIMERPARRWLDWRHDRNSPHVLYQQDVTTARGHVYGELSWGFTDVEVQNDTMTVTYCRWLDFDRFLEITGQDRRAWDQVYMDDTMRQKNILSGAVPVKKILKKRKFSTVSIKHRAYPHY